MSKSTAKIIWQRGDQKFVDNRYSRKHLIRFDGGLEIPASSSPDVVPIPYSDPAAVDPEEMLIAALANCHMLWFLSLAAKKGFCVDTYVDEASGIIITVPKTTLRPGCELLIHPPEHIFNNN